MNKQDLALKAQGQILELECTVKALLCEIYKEGRSKETMTCLQDADMYLDKVHKCLVSASKEDGEVVVFGGGGGR